MLQIIFTIAYIIGSLSLDFTTWEDDTAELLFTFEPSPYELCSLAFVSDNDSPIIDIHMACVAS